MTRRCELRFKATEKLLPAIVLSGYFLVAIFGQLLHFSSGCCELRHSHQSSCHHAHDDEVASESHSHENSSKPTDSRLFGKHDSVSCQICQALAGLDNGVFAAVGIAAISESNVSLSIIQSASPALAPCEAFYSRGPPAVSA